MDDPATGAETAGQKRLIRLGMRRPFGKDEVSTQVRFPDSEEDDITFTEDLVMEYVGERLWRLEESPMCSEFAAWHDVVEADTVDGELIVRRLVQKSGCRTIRVLVHAGFWTSEEGADFFRLVLEAGGMWETYSQGYLVLNVPEDSDVDWEGLLAEALEAFARAAVPDGRRGEAK